MATISIERRLSNHLSQGWSILLVRGIIGIGFGLVTWASPAHALGAVVATFGLYALLDGTLATIAAVRGRRKDDYWWVLLLGGLIGIGIGILALAIPTITTVVLLFFISTWAVARGVLEIALAFALRHEVSGEWRFAAGGVVSVAFGVFLMVRPELGVVVVLWLVGGYAMAFGILLVLLALRFRALVAPLRRS